MILKLYKELSLKRNNINSNNDNAMSGIMNRKFVKLHDLVNACIVLSKTSNLAVSQVLKRGSIGAVQKGDSKLDLCTEADLRIQKTLSHNLRNLYPRS